MTRRLIRRPLTRAATGHALAIGLMVLMGPACDKMPLTAPSDTTISLFANKLTVGLNGTVDITATVIESAGTPVQNGTVVTFTTTLGSIDPAEARTNAGKATVRFNSGGQSGTAEIRALSGGNAVADALTISVGAAAAARVELLANPTALPATGGTVQLTAIVSDSSGNRLGGVPVSFTTDTGILGLTSVTSDANGEARTNLTTTAKAVVSASVSGGADGSVKSENLSIPVRVGPTVTVSVTSVQQRARVAVHLPGDGHRRRGRGPLGRDRLRRRRVARASGRLGGSIVSHVYNQERHVHRRPRRPSMRAGETASASSSVSVQTVVVSVTLAVTTNPVTTTAPTSFTALVQTNPATAIIERYEWDFGDGTIRTTSSGNTTHLYALGGGRRYFVTVRAVTTTGAAGSTTVEIVVQ